MFSWFPNGGASHLATVLTLALIAFAVFGPLVLGLAMRRHDNRAAKTGRRR